MNYVRPLTILVLSIMVGIYLEKKKIKKKKRKEKKTLLYPNAKSLCFLKGPTMWFFRLASPWCKQTRPKPTDTAGSFLGNCIHSD